MNYNRDIHYGCYRKDKESILKEHMIIEIKEKGGEAFYRELVNVLGQYRALIKKPDMKLADNFKVYRNYLIVSAVFIVLLGIFGITGGFDYLMVIAMSLLALESVFMALILRNYTKYVNDSLKDKRTGVLTLDDKGVELKKEEALTYRSSWEEIAFVRRFKESVCFIPKEKNMMVIAVIPKYQEEIFNYLKENKPEVKVI